MKKLLITIMSVMLIFSISQAYVVTIHGPNCTFKMSSPSDSEIILSDLKNGIRWWKVTDNSNNIIGVINNEFMMPEDNVKVTPMYEGNQIVSIQTEGGAIKYNENKVNTVETVEGENYTFIIEADTGYKIKSLIIDGTTTTVNNSYTFTNVKENHTIKATFEKIIPILSKDWFGTPTVGETTIEKSSITSISLVDTYTPGEGVKTYWNASKEQADGILTAYLEDGSENGTYKITIAGNGAGKIGGDTALFSGFTGVMEINGLALLDPLNVRNVSVMFYNCHRLQSLDLSHFNTVNVTSMGNIFNGCSSLQSIDISHFDTSKVTSFDSVFYNCRNLQSVNLGRIDTSKVKDMGTMFKGCSSLTSLDLSNFNTSNVTNMGGMFKECSSLTSLDLSNFNTSNVTNMGDMFKECSSLTSLDLSNFNTEKVKNMTNMFDSCNNLQQITLGENFSFYGANKGVEGATVLTTLPNPVGGETWYDENGTEYTKEDGVWRDEDGNELGESGKTVTYYATNPVQ